MRIVPTMLMLCAALVLSARETLDLPAEWKFSGLSYDGKDYPTAKLPAQAELPGFDDSKWQMRMVPKNWLEDIPEARKAFYMSGIYRTKITIPSAWQNHRVQMNFDGASYDTTIFVNGVKAGFHRGAYAPFSIDLGDAVRFGAENTIAVRVDYTNDKSRRATLNNYPFPGDRGGLYGAVRLEKVPPVSIARCFIDADPATGKVNLRVRVVNNTANQKQSKKLSASVAGRHFELGTFSLPTGIHEITANFTLPGAKIWEIGKPNLYRLDLRLGEDAISERFGFAKFRTAGDKLIFNGKPITLFARHFGGFFLPNGALRRLGAVSVPWAEQKKSLLELFSKQRGDNCNMIRFHGAHGSPKFAYEATDETGLLVYQEWSTYGVGKNLSEKYLDDALAEIAEFLEMTYNDPSVVMFSFANESGGTKAQSIAYAKTKARFQDRYVLCASSGFLPILRGEIDNAPLTDLFDIHTYTGMSFRVMMPDDKVSWTKMTANLETVYQRFLRSYQKSNLPTDRPFLAMEVPAGGWAHASVGNPSDYFDARKELPPEAYLRAAAISEKQGALPLGAWDMKNASLGDKFGGPERNMAILNKIDKHSIEGVRRHPKIRGVCVASASLRPPTVQRLVYQEILPVALKHDVHFFSGDTLPLEFVILNDSQQALSKAELLLVLRKSDGSLPNYDELLGDASAGLVKKSYPLAPIPAGERRSLVCNFSVPKDLAPGDYRLDLIVQDDGKVAGINTYLWYLRGRDTFAPIHSAYSHIGLIGSEKETASLQKILRAWGISTTILSDRLSAPELKRQLDRLDALLVAPFRLDRKSAWAANGAVVRSWIERGGALLAMEIKGQGAISFLPEWTLGDEGPSWFADLGPGRGHPIANGLAQRHFDSWNGSDGYLAREVILPMNRNMLAVTACVESDQLGAPVLEANVKKGRVMLSNLLALDRFGTDSVATSYLHNLFSYFLANKPYRTCEELGAGKKYSYDCDLAKCFFVDLRGHANRNFADAKRGDRTGWADQQENDLRHIPRGTMDAEKRIWEIEYNPIMRDKQIFAGIPFDVIVPEKNHGKSCLVLQGDLRRQFPEAIRKIPVNRKAKKLYFLHTAVFGHAPKVARYELHYEDGSKEVIALRGKHEIGNWWAPVHLDKALKAWSAVHPVTRQTVGVYAMEYVNLHPEKKIVSLDFISEKRVVPVLLAITGIAD
ncbi:MAG: hypothetical protein PHS41_03410 [Victivallaceae bacterium]|nr:hypothetical protein [Victivallaceae bacterium]